MLKINVIFDYIQSCWTFSTDMSRMKEIVEGLKDLYPKKSCGLILREGVSDTSQDCNMLKPGQPADISCVSELHSNPHQDN